MSKLLYDSYLDKASILKSEGKFEKAESLQKAANLVMKNIREKTYKSVFEKAFEAAGTGRLQSTWTITNTSYDYDIRNGLENLRARSRDLAQNNEYAKRFLNLCVTNIVGPNGIVLQNKAVYTNGKPDKTANSMIETEWRAWGKRQNCTYDKTMSWIDCQRTIIETVARDGEIFIYKHKNTNNKYRYAIQLLEADFCDVNFNDASKNIKMGIEYNKSGAPIAYHMFTEHPGDSFRYTSTYVERVRIPADQIVHVFYKERPSQTRGVPWMHAGMKNLRHLGAYKEAEIVAARVFAAKMGFFTSPDGGMYKGEKDSDGNIQIEAEPGTFEQVPAGLAFEPWDPQHPNAVYKDFIKAEIQGLAAALNVSYMALAQDLEGASYSSGRIGSLDERDNWRVKQQWLSDCLHNNIFADFLDNLLLLGITPLPYTKYDKFNSPKWFPRGWDWVDPAKDARANIEELKNHLKSHTEILSERGVDFQDLVDQIKYEQEYIKESGLSVSNNNNGDNQNGK